MAAKKKTNRRGLRGTVEEHAAQAARYTDAAEAMIERARERTGVKRTEAAIAALEQSAHATAECMWTNQSRCFLRPAAVADEAVGFLLKKRK